MLGCLGTEGPACTPGLHSECRNTEDVITFTELSDVPVNQLVVLPSGNCMRRADMTSLRSRRDPYTNLDLSNEWWQRCVTNLGTASSGNVAGRTRHSAATHHETVPRGPTPTCRRGQYLFRSQEGLQRCEECPAGKTTAEAGAVGVGACSTGCGTGQRMTDQQRFRCEQCERGRFGASEFTAVCPECPRGRYAGSEGRTQCDNCAAGRDTTRTGSFASRECVPCEAGQSNARPGEICQSCAAGTFSGLSGSTHCIGCDVGRSTEGRTGQTACGRCRAGKYSDIRSAAQCTACPRSSFSSVVGARSALTCERCPAGHETPNEGSSSLTECRACPMGTFILHSHNACQFCPSNTWSDAMGAADSRVCRPCPESSPYSFPGTISQDKCTSIPWERVIWGVIIAFVTIAVSIICLNR